MIVIRQARIIETDKPKSWETTFGSRAEAEKYIKMIRGGDGRKTNQNKRSTQSNQEFEE